MTAKICIYVQHLLGSGHLYRMVHLANALAQSGYKIYLISGGMPLSNLSIHSHITFIQLPPLQVKDEKFSEYFDADGTVVSEKAKEARRDKLLSVFDSIWPDIMIFEMFPFGRRQLAFEIEPLLNKLVTSSKAKPKIICSLRDILNVKPNSRDKHKRIIEYIDCYFDYIWVHGDPQFVTLDRTFSDFDKIQKKIIYTGYIHHSSPINNLESQIKRRKEITVSVGGGRVGKTLALKAFKAYQSLALQEAFQAYQWTFLLGVSEKYIDFDAENLQIMDKVPDLYQQLCQSEISISQLGYNSFCDVVASGVKSIFIPFETGTENEQACRAQMLQECKAPYVILESHFRETDMMNALIKLASEKVLGHFCIDLRGTQKTLQLLEAII